MGAIGPDGKRAQVSHARSYVDVAAPGGKGIVSTGPNGPGYFTESPDGGTSFAAPYVSGTVALVRAYRPHLSPAQVAELIKESASPAPDGVGLGAGVVNPYAALTMQLPGVEVTTNPAPRPAGYAPPSDPTDELNVTLMAALGTTAGGVLVGFVVIGLGVALPRGSRRRWRPGRRAAPQPEEPAEEEEAPPLPGAVLGGSPSGE